MKGPSIFVFSSPHQLTQVTSITIGICTPASRVNISGLKSFSFTAQFWKCLENCRKLGALGKQAVVGLMLFTGSAGQQVVRLDRINKMRHFFFGRKQDVFFSLFFKIMKQCKKRATQFLCYVSNPSSLLCKKCCEHVKHTSLQCKNIFKSLFTCKWFIHTRAVKWLFINLN